MKIFITAAAGTAKRIPKKPKSSPNAINAKSTQIAESPTLSPTIFGVITKPSRS